MCKEIDARGLSCPEPILMVTREMNRISSGTLRIKVSNIATKENVTRMAKGKGWQVEVTNEGEDIILILRK